MAGALAASRRQRINASIQDVRRGPVPDCALARSVVNDLNRLFLRFFARTGPCLPATAVPRLQCPAGQPPIRPFRDRAVFAPTPVAGARSRGGPRGGRCAAAIARSTASSAGSRRNPEHGSSFFDRGRSSKVTFQVPAAHWGPILSSPLPAHEDANPAKWVGLGQLQIKLAGGDSFLALLYRLSEDPGAFSSGPTFEQRTYGSTAGLEEALDDALKASEKKPGE